jgi:hypothetical protein
MIRPSRRYWNVQPGRTITSGQNLKASIRVIRTGVPRPRSNVSRNPSLGVWYGIGEQKKRTRITKRDVFSFTQHALSNPLIEVDGDRSTARWYVLGNHGLKRAENGYVIRTGAIYSHELVRTAQDWRINRHHCEVLWTDNPKGLLRTQLHDNFQSLIGTA